MSNRLQLLAQCIVQKQNISNKGTKSLPDVYIVAAKRTPIGSYMGKLSNISGPQLAGYCIRSALQSIYLSPKHVQQAILGNVLSAGVGQAPARQAAILGGLDISTTCTTVNKVCASGMKSIVLGSQSIQLGHSKVVVVGGFQSMSNAPHLVMNARKGVGHGDKVLVDALTHDGLTDAFKHISMGLCAQKTAKQMNITREMQDQYCIMTYQRHIDAAKNNYLKNQIIPIEIISKDRKQSMAVDQQAKRYKQQTISKLKPAFDKNGTITSANASKINDGACCMVLMSADKMKQTNTKGLARIVAYADAEVESVDFCKSPFYSAMKALKKAGLEVKDIDYFEFNQAFSIVPIAMMQMMGISKDKVNVLGGAVAMGHPIGASGARIVQSLMTTLKLKNAKYGLAGICNGGGGSTAIIIQNI